ncbi:hypothetical protein [Flavobacterium sp.]|uniref:hypothetical protein n=1 Tax=Flavobacterium sp. TaxID=239 RepID=UPI0028BE986E|nr:hypothetical protein [Flavobacterium sp.]
MLPNPVCAGQQVTLTFTTTNGNGNNGQYDSDTVFIACLSSNTGGAPYSAIGVATLLPYTFTTGNGAVNSGVQALVTIPTTASGNYRISLASIGPLFLGGFNGTGASPLFTVNPLPTGGTISGSTSVCPGANSTTLTLSGHTGSVVKWQSSPVNDFSSGVVDIANTTTSYTAVNVATTTYYRCVVTNGLCEANSNVATITVNPTAGTVSSDQSICSGTQPANIVLSGSTGTIQWQRSTDNVTFVNINGATNATLTSGQMGTLTATRYYRARLTGGCGTIFSAVVTVTVTPQTVGGDVNSDVDVCYGNNSTTLTLSGHTGAVVKWQSSLQQNFNNPVDIANTATTLTVTNLTTTTYYRAVVQSGNCAQVNSTSARVRVRNVPNGGTLSGSATVCYGINSTALTLSGHSGTIQKWQYSLVSDFSSGVVDVSNTSASLTVSNLTVTRYYRVVLVNNFGCTANSTVATITVIPQLNASIVSNNSPVCAGGNAIFNLSGTTGATVTYTINGGANQVITLTGGSAAVTISGVTVNQTLTLVSISLAPCSIMISGSSTVVINSTNQWTGAINNQWSTAGNWSCGIVPTAATNVIINSGSIQISGINALAASLALNGTSVITVISGNNLTITNALNVASGASFVLQNNANLVQVNNVSNTGNITVNRNSSALMRQDYTMWGSPVSNQNLLSFSPQTLANRFYEYTPSTNVYTSISPSGNFALGKGYLIRMPNNHPTTPTIWNGQYTGVPNNGAINLTTSNGGAGFRYNAISNPYPSPVNMTSFVNGNSGNITGTLYFWRKTNNANTEPGYCTWTTAGFVSNGEAQVVNPNGILRTGQGFLVEMTGSSTTVAFTNAMRSTNTANQFFKTAVSNDELSGDRIWLNVSNTSGANNQMLVGYFDSATLDVDFGIDGKAIEDAPVSLNMDIDGTKYIIQGRPTFAITDVVPLSFKTTFSGSHTIAVDHLDGIFTGTQNIYLKDNMLNVMHDIKASDYNFTSDVGAFDNRFEIHYQESTLGSDEQLFANAVTVFKNTDGNLMVTSKSDNLNQVSVYNIEGKLLADKKDIDANVIVFSNLRMENSVLLVRITTQDGLVVQKKILF